MYWILFLVILIVWACSLTSLILMFKHSIIIYSLKQAEQSMPLLWLQNPAETEKFIPVIVKTKAKVKSLQQ